MIEQALSWFKIRTKISQSDNFKQYSKVAINALEKQIPKKPIKEEYGVCKCPVCNDLEVKDHTTGVKFKYCHNCGQALDWSDTE